MQDTAVGAPEAKPPKVNFGAVLKNAGFRNLWLGQVVSQIGDYFSFLATTVLVSGFSKDPQQITLAVSGMMLANSLPRLLFGILSGVFVDRWDRRLTMLNSDLVRIGLALLLIPAFMAQNLWAMYALGFMLSTLGTLFMPAKGALIPKLVPKEQLLAANSLSQITMMLSILLGPALAGLTISAAGSGNEWVAFAVDAATFLVSAIAVRLIRIPKRDAMPDKSSEQHEGEASAVRRVWNEMLVGLKVLFLNRAVATLAVVFGITMLGVGAINVLWVVFLKNRFGFEGTELAWRFSLLDIAFAAGMLAAAALAGNFLSHIPPKWFLVIALVGVGLPLIVIGFVYDYWWMAALNFALGAFVAPIETASTTIMQIVVPNNQLGRVGGGIGTVSETATVLSMSFAGVAGAALGAPVVFAIGGVMCMLAGLLAWVRLPNVTMKDMPLENSTPDMQQEGFVIHPEATIEADLPFVEVGAGR